jgi:hypothetical protein
MTPGQAGRRSGHAAAVRDLRRGTHAHRFLELDLKPGVTAIARLAASVELHDDENPLSAPDKVRDRLTDFSRPVTGAYDVAPSLRRASSLDPNSRFV